jgi:hypothetical protein
MARFFALEPDAWSPPGFWEAVCEREPGAVALFEDLRRTIVTEDP